MQTIFENQFICTKEYYNEYYINIFVLKNP